MVNMENLLGNVTGRQAKYILQESQLQFHDLSYDTQLHNYIQRTCNECISYIGNGRLRLFYQTGCHDNHHH